VPLRSGHWRGDVDRPARTYPHGAVQGLFLNAADRLLDLLASRLRESRRRTINRLRWPGHAITLPAAGRRKALTVECLDVRVPTSLEHGPGGAGHECRFRVAATKNIHSLSAYVDARTSDLSSGRDRALRVVDRDVATAPGSSRYDEVCCGYQVLVGSWQLRARRVVRLRVSTRARSCADPVRVQDLARLRAGGGRTAI